MAERSKKLHDFISMVDVMVPMLVDHFNRNGNHYAVDLQLAFDALGKARKVTDRELENPRGGSLSDRARDFALYQLHLTTESPIWWEGKKLNRS